MKKLVLVLLLLAVLLPARAEAQGMQRLYLVPVETNGNYRGPMYFDGWRGDPSPGGIASPWAMMDYGFTPYALLLAKDISQADHDALILNADVFVFPDNLDGPVNDPNVDTFFEAIHLPTDWLTPSTTWRELLRQVAGIFQFNQRYAYISSKASGVTHSIFDTATLDTRLNQMTTDEQAWFLATVESFGYDPELVPLNARLRQLVKQAGDYWQDRPFYLGGWEF